MNVQIPTKVQSDQSNAHDADPVRSGGLEPGGGGSLKFGTFWKPRWRSPNSIESSDAFKPNEVSRGYKVCF